MEKISEYIIHIGDVKIIIPATIYTNSILEELSVDSISTR